MGSSDDSRPDCLAFSRRAAERAAEALATIPGATERARALGRGKGGDMTLAIDGAVEDAVLDELEGLGHGLRAVSEERGEFDLCGGGPTRVVIDPIDGSLNAKRGLPLYSLSIAVADGDTMQDVHFGYVYDLSSGEEFWAERGRGAYLNAAQLELDGASAKLEMLAVESANPRLVAAGADALAGLGAHRLRMIGSIALSLCYVASARFDAMLSLRPARSVDAAAGQLIVREAGGLVSFPDDGGDSLATPLGLDMRSRVRAAASRELLDALESGAPSG